MSSEDNSTNNIPLDQLARRPRRYIKQLLEGRALTVFEVIGMMIVPARTGSSMDTLTDRVIHEGASRITLDYFARHVREIADQIREERQFALVNNAGGVVAYAYIMAPAILLGAHQTFMALTRLLPQVVVTRAEFADDPDGFIRDVEEGLYGVGHVVSAGCEIVEFQRVKTPDDGASVLTWTTLVERFTTLVMDRPADGPPVIVTSPTGTVLEMRVMSLDRLPDPATLRARRTSHIF